MTDRFCGFVVTLERDIREDDAEATIAAIRQIKGVVSVGPVTSDPAFHAARERVRWEYLDKLYRFCSEIEERPGRGQ